MLRFLGVALCLSPVLPLVLGLTGGLHPIGDSFAVFRWHFAVLTGLGALILFTMSWKWLKGVAAVWFGVAIFFGTGVLWAGLEHRVSEEAKYSLYQKNLSFRLADKQAVVSDILQHNPDFVTLQEVNEANTEVLSALAGQYQSQLTCGFLWVGAVSVASRWPMVEGSERCIERLGAVAIQVITADGPLWLVSVHLHWPYPHTQARQIERLRPFLNGLDGRVVVGGDFNMVPWSYAMHSLLDLTETERAGAVSYTYSLFNGFLELPIDHVLVPATEGQETRTQLRPLLGSDHMGILARFKL
ncbi:endonuclease/exonuclease/phosphatase family protein [Pseudohalocynthiibacter aestuariivivens]|jgi:endonuclease/exonuclease/phosphatase (EEP) superfamily protein YafD|uniref:Endonuclease/exonuclease/phosphatase family protein n=1 Tax=Pseudohalocynthiibacter aestuariivivens TaxID=1591409 RepID=A0ABV5JCG5_9RHOB|nr:MULTISPECIES: endonuclease/exonuclease/phosphatase family protein [Pseudohalocynthiibacter]MBS9718590.1 endonuclease/exonuclease/phosphatase family protein [Pseudohalocynthiibacter aestuariivivens]MCK0103602.1 endonuclease/exonuclease/phosphatase family protein [Pseudohalocynthiibacter sp. F2068]